MKALRFHEYGGRDKLVVESVPDPVAGPGEVVVKVGACALNHLDVDFREGISRFPLELPLIMGLELAGTIVSVGAGRLRGVEGRRSRRAVPAWAPIPRTCCRARAARTSPPPRSSARRSRAATPSTSRFPQRHLVRTPDSMTDVEAAAFQIAFGTSYHMLFTRGELKMGETVLINSVGSGIGAAAVQLAKLAGAYVIGNATQRREARQGARARHARGHQPRDARRGRGGHADHRRPRRRSRLRARRRQALPGRARLAHARRAARDLRRALGRGRRPRHHRALPQPDAHHRLVHVHLRRVRGGAAPRRPRAAQAAGALDVSRSTTRPRRSRSWRRAATSARS